MNLDDFLNLLIKVFAVGGGGAVVAFGFFQFLGARWLENRFEQRLESLRHEHAKELQSLRIEIDTALQGRLRIQEKELEVLTTCWDLMNNALGAAQDYVSLFQSYPDISRMSDTAKNEYLATLEIFEFQRREIIESHQPNETLKKYIELRKRNTAGEAHSKFHNYLKRHEIFIDERIWKELLAVANELKDALISRDISQDYGDHDGWRKSWNKVQESCGPRVSKISEDLRWHIRESFGIKKEKS